jgi:hypothetical protein
MVSGVSSFLLQNKINAGSVSEFSQGVRTFVPSLNVCPVANSVDQFGRPGGYGSLNTLSAPGCYSIQQTINTENSLRPVISSHPLYKNIQAGIAGGVDTLYGMNNPGRGNMFNTYQFAMQEPGHPSCLTAVQNNLGAFGLPQAQCKGMLSDDYDMVSSIVGSNTKNDRIKNTFQGFNIKPM